MNWLYLALDLGSIAVPLAFSFDKRIAFYRNWKYLFPALFIMAFIFLVWDAWFTAEGIWEFNSNYVLGIDIGNMPFEEYLFFIFIPYACVFTHEALKFYIPETKIDRHGRPIANWLIILFTGIAVVYHDRLYTLVTFSSLAVALAICNYVLKFKGLGRFFFSYLVTVIPFLLVNGFLTAMPVLIYNNDENSGIRIGTIPLEDFFYWMLLYLGGVVIFELLKHKHQPQKQV